MLVVLSPCDCVSICGYRIGTRGAYRSTDAMSFTPRVSSLHRRCHVRAATDGMISFLDVIRDITSYDGLRVLRW